MEKVIILFGKPGAGKGTRLSEFLSNNDQVFEVLSLGNLIRKAIREQTDLGKKLEFYLNAGLLAPDEIINELVFDVIRHTKKSVIIDGYPRTIVQASAMLDAGIFPHRVIELYVDDAIVLERAKARIVCSNCGEPYTTNSYKPPKTEGICDKCGGTLVKRKDDSEEIVNERLKVYQKQTHPVLAFLASNGIAISTILNSTEDAKVKFADLLTH